MRDDTKVYITPPNYLCLAPRFIVGTAEPLCLARQFIAGFGMPLRPPVSGFKPRDG